MSVDIDDLLRYIDELRRMDLRAFDTPEDEQKYLRRIKWLEQHPDNQPGSDKTWVERLVAESREHFRRAIRVR